MSYWFAGAGTGLLLAVAAVVVHRRRRETWLLVAVIAAFPVGYFFWWATSLGSAGAASGLGPLYYIPAFSALAVLGGWALRDIAHRSAVLATVSLVVVGAASLVMASPILDNAHAATDIHRAKAAPLTDSRLDNALVVMRAAPSKYTLLDFPFLVGDPRLHGRALYAIDRGPASAALAARFPSRKLYQFVQRTEPGHDLLRPSYIVEPLHVRTGRLVTTRFEATNPAGQPLVIATLKIDGHTVATQTLDRHSSIGATLPFAVVLTSGGDLPAPRNGLLAARIDHDAQVAVDVAFARDASLSNADVYSRRYFVSHAGDDLALQTPGLQYHRYDFGRVVWIREAVGSRLREQRG
jgi:hypothetical protein